MEVTAEAEEGISVVYSDLISVVVVVVVVAVVVVVETLPRRAAGMAAAVQVLIC